MLYGRLLQGGDFDVLVISAKPGHSDHLYILADLHEQLGEQKVNSLIDEIVTGDFARTYMHAAIRL